ncbi:helix-turn-helix domain-containing protein [Streptomyces erythrochromogenes]|uniref:helix-turn-helix domain-containing protein n=1 Tax=Streptomyces erythrochromogenes TaxID=285574 RepID=UPI00380F9F97
MTVDQFLPRQIVRPPLEKSSARRAAGLPEPGERRRLREQWGLTTRQVAMAFGVTPATVRSWECGRTAPRGVRREAYRRFLAGLAQHTAVDVQGSAGPRPAPPVPPKAVPQKAVPQKAVPPSPPPPARVVGRVDPVPPGRVRRLRVLGATACAWSLAALWVILTCPPPL